MIDMYNKDINKYDEHTRTNFNPTYNSKTSAGGPGLGSPTEKILVFIMRCIPLCIWNMFRTHIVVRLQYINGLFSIRV